MHRPRSTSVGAGAERPRDAMGRWNCDYVITKPPRARSRGEDVEEKQGDDKAMMGIMSVMTGIPPSLVSCVVARIKQCSSTDSGTLEPWNKPPQTTVRRQGQTRHDATKKVIDSSSSASLQAASGSPPITWTLLLLCRRCSDGGTPTMQTQTKTMITLTLTQTSDSERCGRQRRR